jgi:large subunit ribosomal protein L6
MPLSRIGKQPVNIPSGVKINLDGLNVSVQGPKGTLNRELKDVLIAVEGEQLILSPISESKDAKSMHGLARALLQNMVIGVSQGFQRKLEIIGVGYRAEVKGKNLVLNLGYSHPVEFPIPEGVKITCESQTAILVESSDKELLGLTAAKIRGFRAPEPYKGKGIKYAEEIIRRKVGKAGAAA